MLTKSSMPQIVPIRLHNRSVVPELGHIVLSEPHFRVKGDGRVRLPLQNQIGSVVHP